jgi:ubiquinone/menaquinone biosynthesis C-methylase UbiE
MKNRKTSWEDSSKWYDKIVGETGHYYHEQVIFPRLLPLLKFDKNSNVLDLGAGQGILARKLPPDIKYMGVDTAPSLIQQAKTYDKNKNHHYLIADVTKQLPLPLVSYTHAIFLLSMQNISEPESALHQASTLLSPTGMLVLILNHPSFRIPRQSGWGVHANNHLQYRYINTYLSPQKIPIVMHPGEKNSPIAWSFHYPLSMYVAMLSRQGFVIEQLEEWTSDKESVGKHAKMENRARTEIPLFLTIIAKKQKNISSPQVPKAI